MMHQPNFAPSCPCVHTKFGILLYEDLSILCNAFAGRNGACACAEQKGGS